MAVFPFDPRTVTDKTLSISAIARLSRTNPSQIRQYEELGLLPLPDRPGVHRRYALADASRLIFLRRCRDLGLLNPRLKLLVELVDSPDHASEESRELATMLLGNVEDQLTELAELGKTLGALLTGAGEHALSVADVEPRVDGVKRMRRLVRKPLKAPTGA